VVQLAPGCHPYSMTQTSRHALRGYRLAATALLAACTSGESSRSSSSAPSASAAQSSNEAVASRCARCDSGIGDIAGGETSEFGGSRTGCTPVSMSPRGLEDPDVAPWLALVEGQHELSFRWEPQYLGIGTSGYERRTSVSLEVHASAATDLEYDSTCSISGAVLLDLAVTLRTADAAVEHTFPIQAIRDIWAEPGSYRMVSDQSAPYPLRDFLGALDLPVYADTDLRSNVFVQLRFSSDGVRGNLLPVLSHELGPGWAPIFGHFPDDGCALWEAPVPLDSTVAAFAGLSVSEALARATSALNGGPLQAQQGGDDIPITIDLGAPDTACRRADDTFVVHAPLHLRGSGLDWAHEAHVVLEPNRSLGGAVARLYMSQPFVPVDQFADAAGISGADFGGLHFAAPDFVLFFTESGGFTGGLGITRTDLTEAPPPQGSQISYLSLCRGDAGCKN
jgi:hypothetical protein